MMRLVITHIIFVMLVDKYSPKLTQNYLLPLANIIHADYQNKKLFMKMLPMQIGQKIQLTHLSFNHPAKMTKLPMNMMHSIEQQPPAIPTDESKRKLMIR